MQQAFEMKKMEYEVKTAYDSTQRKDYIAGIQYGQAHPLLDYFKILADTLTYRETYQTIMNILKTDDVELQVPKIKLLLLGMGISRDLKERALKDRVPEVEWQNTKAFQEGLHESYTFCDREYFRLESYAFGYQMYSYIMNNQKDTMNLKTFTNRFISLMWSVEECDYSRYVSLSEAFMMFDYDLYFDVPLCGNSISLKLFRLLSRKDIDEAIKQRMTRKYLSYIQENDCLEDLQKQQGPLWKLYQVEEQWNSTIEERIKAYEQLPQKESNSENTSSISYQKKLVKPSSVLK